jgi:hypothetical protein
MMSDSLDSKSTYIPLGPDRSHVWAPASIPLVTRPCRNTILLVYVLNDHKRLVHDRYAGLMQGFIAFVDHDVSKSSARSCPPLNYRRIDVLH